MVRTLIGWIKRFRQRAELSQYDDYSIAELFRAQGARIGANNRLCVRSLGPEPYLISIGNHCTLSVNVMLNTHDGGTWLFTDEIPSLQHFGPIEILDNCFIGARAIVMPGVRIGPNSIVGAGAVVTKDVPPSTIVAGCPARKVSDLQDYKRRVIEAWSEQRPKNYMAGLIDGRSYPPSVIFEKKIADAALLRSHLEHLFWGNSTKQHDQSLRSEDSQGS